MIGKHVAMNNQAKSDFAGLVIYITDGQGKEHRLEMVTITNCLSDTLEAATEEILATQGMNKRATGDKTYHLLLSFRAGESPDQQVMKEIEERVCASLGFTGHQRISAVHNDTDNLHIHIAINKIHPEKHTMQEPYKAYKTLAEICEKLEIEYGLERDNHTPRHSLSQGKVNDMERHSGIESLSSWIKSECLSDLQAAKSWEQLHEVMQANGLSITPRGSGLVIESIGSGVTVKPSTVSRDLSKGALEKRLGEYQVSQHAPIKAERSYTEKPIELKGVNTVELYAQYQQSQAQNKTNQSKALIALRGLKASKINDAKASNKLRRQAIKLMGGSPLAKRILYAQASSALKRQIQKINADAKAETAKLYRNNKRETWADWLKSEGLKGNDEAIAALRARGAINNKNTLQGVGPKSKIKTDRKKDGLTKKGTFVLRGKGAIKDDGQRLRLQEKADRETFKEALALAAEKYGNRITVTGSALFKAQAVQAAVESKIQISFADPVLEAKRQKLLAEKKHDRPDDRNRVGRSTSDAGRRERVAHRSGADSNRQRSGAGAGAGAARELFSKPDVARVGAKPPPQSQNRLRGLSELGVVHLTPRGEVLLPSDVSNNVEQQGAKPDNKLRRATLGGGGLKEHSKYTENQVAAMDKYISERESKREKGVDISKHLRYNGESENLNFAGLRKIDNQDLALIKNGDSVLVMPINSATASRLKRVKIGQPLSITDRGAIQAGSGRGKSR